MSKKLCPSIIITDNDTELETDEYYQIHNFFITNSLCDNLSKRKKKISDYGYRRIYDVKKINSLIPIDSENFDVYDCESLLSEDLINFDLIDDRVFDLSRERGLTINFKEKNEYLNIFHAIRNSLAHGEYTLKLNNENEKFFIMQNSDGNSVKARIVIKVNTLLELIRNIENKD